DLGLAGLLDARLVALDQAEVVFRRHRGQAVRQQIVTAIAVLDLNQVALLAEVGHVLRQHQLHAAVTALAYLIALFGWHGESVSMVGQKGISPSAGASGAPGSSPPSS